MTATEANLRKKQTTSTNDNTAGEPKHGKENESKNQKTKTKFAALSKEMQHATSSTTHRIWTRMVIALAVAILAYFYNKNQARESTFALSKDSIPFRMQTFSCAPSYETEIQQFPQCVPKKCGRFIIDKLIDVEEAEVLLDLARNVLTKVGSSGGASILDIHSGALSYKEGFVNITKIDHLMALLTDEALKVYNFVKNKIKNSIASQFGISSKSLYLTYPTFFSRITNTTAKTLHDEYWHEHVDKETYPSFHYTSLLYLTTFHKDFEGGRFVFVDGSGENRTISMVEPRLARMSAFTSGAENRHYVEQVTEGERYAITISFTCNEKLRINDPQFKTKN